MKAMQRIAPAVVMGSILCLILLTASASAQEEIDETRKASANARVSISNIKGSVIVAGWDRKEVHVEGHLGRGSEEFIFEGDDDRLEIEVVLPKRSRRVEDTDLKIHLPRGSEVEISTISADVEVAEVLGELSVQTISGQIIVTGNPEEVEVESISGRIHLQVQTKMTSASSISGKVKVIDAQGDLEVETISGDAIIEGGTFDDLDVSSASGSIRFTGDLAARGTFSLECHSGDIKLILPDDVDADFEINTFSGDIENEFGPQARRTSKFTPGKELEFTTGSGDAQVQVETFSGNVELIKR